jgi:hypothetical protein
MSKFHSWPVKRTRCAYSTWDSSTTDWYGVVPVSRILHYSVLSMKELMQAVFCYLYLYSVLPGFSVFQIDDNIVAIPLTAARSSETFKLTLCIELTNGILASRIQVVLSFALHVFRLSNCLSTKHEY